ncbi:metalloprotease [Lysinibacillus sp. 2017]|uniref:KPN_02809 family neutral zinc metallopeptidase n=1 Tax=unclassified Lysinibacillus TaxID=2636778 RepID=UPI000D5270E1|nr:MULTISPECIES: neutral zinc metallopeptidase [unclassified Lysinibacillus]AWE08977.1 metalloprotease [Lysinibacillus sp. 2017]TGN35514.1 metalloprotease [Lysinibacillus sp. S2017]
MDVNGRRKSSNVEDRRGMSAGKIGGGLGGVGIIIAIIFTLLNGGDAGDVIGEVSKSITQNGQTTEQYQPTAEEEELADFVSVVLADTEDVWQKVFKAQGKTYANPTLVLFTNSVSSGCGTASAAVGPFYCPADQKLYIDLSFYKELKNQFNAPGDFAMAYVVAHEVGHHVQTLLGISQQVHALNGKASQEEYNAATVRLELQADYLAGVWAHHVQNKGYLEEGDFEEALTAANAIGDDTLQMEAQGYVVPESFTHGTSEQRMRWFKKGFELGTLNGGDTFNAANL